MIKLLYFAGLREALGTAAEQWVPAPDVGTVGALRAHLAARGGVWAEQFAPQRNLRAAVNQDMRGLDHPVADGDEVAFFPPVTGG
jgi:molybdopterin synthase sulfur carrier subunit